MTRTFAAICLALATALPALAQSYIEIDDPYARVSRPNAPTGAVFMTLKNTGPTDDRLIAAAFAGARKTELHTHILNAQTGVARMIEVGEGFELPAGSLTPLARGGKHIMLMGLDAPLEDGEIISLSLTFEGAGEIQVMVPVDSRRAPDHGGHGGGHGHGTRHGTDG